MREEERGKPEKLKCRERERDGIRCCVVLCCVAMGVGRERQREER
jgi:hypothetical protein